MKKIGFRQFFCFRARFWRIRWRKFREFAASGRSRRIGKSPPTKKKAIFFGLGAAFRKRSPVENDASVRGPNGEDRDSSRGHLPYGDGTPKNRIRADRLDVPRPRRRRADLRRRHNRISTVVIVITDDGATRSCYKRREITRRERERKRDLRTRPSDRESATVIRDTVYKATRYIYIYIYRLHTRIYYIIRVSVQYSGLRRLGKSFIPPGSQSATNIILVRIALLRRYRKQYSRLPRIINVQLLTLLHISRRRAAFNRTADTGSRARLITTTRASPAP